MEDTWGDFQQSCEKMVDEMMQKEENYDDDDFDAEEDEAEVVDYDYDDYKIIDEEIHHTNANKVTDRNEKLDEKYSNCKENVDVE